MSCRFFSVADEGRDLESLYLVSMLPDQPYEWQTLPTLSHRSERDICRTWKKHRRLGKIMQGRGASRDNGRLPLLLMHVSHLVVENEKRMYGCYVQSAMLLADALPSLLRPPHIWLGLPQWSMPSPPNAYPWSSHNPPIASDSILECTSPVADWANAPGKDSKDGSTW